VKLYDRGVRPSRDVFSLPSEGEGEFPLSQFFSYALGGIALVAAFAFAGHYMGQNAAARSLPELDLRPVESSPVSSISTKASLLAMPFEMEALPGSGRQNEQIVQLATKGDFYIDDTILPNEDTTARLASLSVTTPPSWKLEESFKLRQDQKNKVLAERKKRLAEQSCLATAVYYEARSESELGQLAVAKVILNRVRDPGYPKTICGVVYQGADKGHGCQFSFACDGRAEQPRSGKAWDEARQIASRAMAGEADVKIISTATHYHADYVQPRWAGTMKRLIKIGRHVFYRDS
jgi:hypothetical protein